MSSSEIASSVTDSALDSFSGSGEGKTLSHVNVFEYAWTNTHKHTQTDYVMSLEMGGW